MANYNSIYTGQQIDAAVGIANSLAAWAKGNNKPTYSWSEINSKPEWVTNIQKIWTQLLVPETGSSIDGYEGGTLLGTLRGFDQRLCNLEDNSADLPDEPEFYNAYAYYFNAWGYLKVYDDTDDVEYEEDDNFNGNDVDATYGARGITVRNWGNNRQYSYMYPRKSGTIALLSDISGGGGGGSSGNPFVVNGVGGLADKPYIPHYAYVAQGKHIYSTSIDNLDSNGMVEINMNDLNGFDTESVEYFIKRNLLQMGDFLTGMQEYTGLQFAEASICKYGEYSFSPDFIDGIAYACNCAGMVPSEYVDSVHIQAIGGLYSAAECSLKMEIYFVDNEGDEKAHIFTGLIIHNSENGTIGRGGITL